ncbi:RNA-directed DNA polymerase, eukaryota [Tanacetum coccineum]
MGTGDWQHVTGKKLNRSKEDDVLSISKSVFVTNFPDSISSRDLWKSCSVYGKVVDVYIPSKKAKTGKRFAFVRFTNVANLDRLVENLCTIWIGKFHLFANHVRYVRPPKHSQKPSYKPIQSSFSAPSSVPLKSFAAVFKDSTVNEASVEPVIVLDDSCIKDMDFNFSLMGKVKEVPTIPNLPVMIAKEGFQNVNIKYLGGLWMLFDFDSPASNLKFLTHSGIRSWFTTLKKADNNFVNDERIVWISVEGLPVKAWTPNSFRKIASIWGELVDWEDEDQHTFSCKSLCLKTKMNVVINEKRKIIIHGSVFWIRVKEFDAWVPDFENDDDSLSSGEAPPILDNANEDSDVDKVSESSFIQEFDNVLNSAHDEPLQSKENEVIPNEASPISEDPFAIYDLLKKNNINSDSKESVDPKFPPGFTPKSTDEETPKEDYVQVSSNNVLHPTSRTKESRKHRGTSLNSHSGSSKLKAGGSIIELMDELVNVGRAMGYKMDGCTKDIELIIGSKGESNFHP